MPDCKNISTAQEPKNNAEPRSRKRERYFVEELVVGG
jgi:hypothetical protein